MNVYECYFVSVAYIMSEPFTPIADRRTDANLRKKLINSSTEANSPITNVVFNYEFSGAFHSLRRPLCCPPIKFYYCR